MLALLVAGCAAAVLLFLASHGGVAPGGPESTDAIAAASSQAAISVAVLPFANLSGDAGQDFFSDGITEEITSALVKIPNLRVVARSSAFQFKGQNADVRKVAQSLGATHIIEGSVRKEGNRLRITAHLAKADSNADIWSKTYDRQATDIFAIQEDIARAIASELALPLRLEPGAQLVTNRNIDPESYEKLLLAKALFDGRVNGSQFAHDRGESLLQEVIAKNADYAPALALLGATYFMHASSQVLDVSRPVQRVRADIEALREKGEVAARRSLELDPELSWGYATLGILTWSRAKPIESEDVYIKGLTLDPTGYYLLDGWAIRIGATGRVKEALAFLDKALAVEPFQPVILARMAQDLWIDGQNDAAIALAKTLRASDRAPTLALVYASMGRYAEAADALMEIADDPQSAAAQAAGLLRTAPAKAAAPADLPRLPADLDFVYLHVGAPERALDLYERRAEIGFLGGNSAVYVWHPSYAPVRKTELFKTVMRKVGLVDYWRQKGWPSACHPTTGDDFICE